MYSLDGTTILTPSIILTRRWHLGNTTSLRHLSNQREDKHLNNTTFFVSPTRCHTKEREQYTWGSVTTLHDFGGELGRQPLDTFFWALTVSRSWLLARVKWRFGRTNPHTLIPCWMPEPLPPNNVRVGSPQPWSDSKWIETTHGNSRSNLKGKTAVNSTTKRASATQLKLACGLGDQEAGIRPKAVPAAGLRRGQH
jgi:hypothetical protein